MVGSAPHRQIMPPHSWYIYTSVVGALPKASCSVSVFSPPRPSLTPGIARHGQILVLLELVDLFRRGNAVNAEAPRSHVNRLDIHNDNDVPLLWPLVELDVTLQRLAKL